MKIRVQLFAAARDAAGEDVVELEVPATATVADLRRGLADTYPALRPLVPNLMFAVDADCADDRTMLRPDADVAAIPPVSGG